MKYVAYLLKDYNNYYNRRIIRDETVKDIISKVDYTVRTDFNFNPNDDVNTEITFNYDTSWMPDYVILQPEMPIDDHDFTRWFVLEAIRRRNGQYLVRLKRDTVADKFKQIAEAPIFIEKAIAQVNDPLLFNSEGMSFNEIKKLEVPLKDETKTNWIVGYINQDTSKLPADTTVSSISYTSDVIDVNELNIQLNDIANLEAGAKFYKENLPLTVSGDIHLPDFARYEGRQLNALFEGDQYNTYKGTSYKSVQSSSISSFASVKGSALTLNISLISSLWGQAVKEKYSLIRNSIISKLEGMEMLPVSIEDNKKIVENDGKLVVYNDKYYKMRITTQTNKKISIDIDDILFGSMKVISNRCKELFTENNIKYIDNDPSLNNSPYSIDTECTEVHIAFEETTGPGVRKVSISKSHQHLIDAPYDIFALPYSIENLNLATQINLKLGQNIYDLQLLPYCPARYMIDSNGVDLSLGTEGKNFDYIKDEQMANVSYILYAIKSSDTFTVSQKIKVPNDPINLKIHNETTKYRLVSPNYNGVFEFSPAKNYGVDYFIIDFTYRPISPYIHVAPNFKGLYGSNFNDARGLICNGDFSIATTSDAWRTYEINNKNYQNIFNTEIKSMDDIHNLQMSQGIASSMMSALGTGAITGGLTGSSAVGGLIGGGSAVMGGIDTLINEASYNIGKQAKINNFNYSLGNIKARPNSLTKVSAYNINNKYFPFLEVFTSTPEEKEMLRDKIKYDGMTIMKIGKISDYLNKQDFSYFKGQLIRLEGIGDESHIVQDIANELNRGVYL